MSQIMPMEPVQMKAARQPQRAVTMGIRAGAMRAEALAPELKRPKGLPRSAVGNHSLTALMAAGKLPDSPRPRKMRAIQNPMTEVTSEWLIEARPQMRMAMGEPALGRGLS